MDYISFVAVGMLRLPLSASVPPSWRDAQCSLLYDCPGPRPCDGSTKPYWFHNLLNNNVDVNQSTALLGWMYRQLHCNFVMEDYYLKVSLTNKCLGPGIITRQTCQPCIPEHILAPPPALYHYYIWYRVQHMTKHVFLLNTHFLSSLHFQPSSFAYPS